ncbi:MAG TPA: Spy/CpxP family protein refolding chaperone [Gemmatimonadales bacterium]
MRRILMLAVVLTLGATTAAWPQHDTARPNREEMRRRLDERFTARVREELKLNDQQAERLRETANTFGGRRRELEGRERSLRTALESQLRPEVAADRDSVARLTDALVDIRGSYAQTFRDEHKEISKFLDPVQRAQLYMMRERLMRRAHEVRGERRGGDFHWRRRPAPAPRDSA